MAKEKNAMIGRMIGSSAHVKGEREKDDFYSTDPMATNKFLDQIQADGITLAPKIWEPACGDGAISKELEKRGHDVFSTDLVDRGYEPALMSDFLEDDIHNQFEGDIVTNPPFKLAQEFVEKSLSKIPNGNLVILFLRIQFLESKGRYKLFQKMNPKYVYVHSSRVSCWKNGDPKYAGKGGAACYAWFVWEKGFTGDTIMRWLE